jgi:TRAP-type C4-dicarboxylate transport system permease small subunit
MDAQRRSHIETMIKWIMEITVWFTSMVLMLMMLLIIYDVFSRYFFRSPSSWIDDFISLYLIIYVTMLPAAWILLKGDHVTVEVFVGMLKPAARRRMTYVTKILCLIYSIVLTWQGGLYTWRELSHGNTFPTTAYLPVWPAVAVIFVGGILLCLAAVMKIVDQAWVQKHYASTGDNLV